MNEGAISTEYLNFAVNLYDLNKEKNVNRKINCIDVLVNQFSILWNG